MESRLIEILREAFPPHYTDELAYLPGPGFDAARMLAYQARIGEVSLDRLGGAGGRIAAVTCDMREWEATVLGPVLTARWRQRFRLEFDSDATLLDGETWARQLRRRLARNTGLVVELEAAPEIVVRAGEKVWR